jgi:hypothetical protein
MLRTFHTICFAILKLKTTILSVYHVLRMNCAKNCDKQRGN